MTFPIDKTEYEWERPRFSEERTSDSEWRSDDRLLTPEQLREWAIALAREGNPLGMDLHRVADAWDRDRRELKALINENKRLRENNATQRKVNRYLKNKISDLNLAKKSLVEERDRLRDLVDTIRDGMSEALLKSATAGAHGTGLYTDAAAAVAFGDIAVSWIEEQEALAATTDSQVNPGEKRDD